MPLVRKIVNRDPYDYSACLNDAERLGLARRQRHRGQNPTPREPKFEMDVLGVYGECYFAQFARLPTTPIYDTHSGQPDFVWHGRTIDVKTFGVERHKPDKRCNLLVPVQEFARHRYDIYVLWGVDIANFAGEGFGWANSAEIGAARIEQFSQRTKLANHAIRRDGLRPIEQLEPYLLSLDEQQTLPDGRLLRVLWDVRRAYAEVLLDGVRRDAIYRAYVTESGFEVARFFTLRDGRTAHRTRYDAVQEAIANIRYLDATMA